MKSSVVSPPEVDVTRARRRPSCRARTINNQRPALSEDTRPRGIDTPGRFADRSAPRRATRLAGPLLEIDPRGRLDGELAPTGQLVVARGGVACHRRIAQVDGLIQPVQDLVHQVFATLTGPAELVEALSQPGGLGDVWIGAEAHGRVATAPKRFGQRLPGLGQRVSGALSQLAHGAFLHAVDQGADAREQ